MEILWSRGESNVRDVIPKLGRPLAYTTVMTTLDRLFKKGFLDRRKSDRAFFYSPSFSRQEWERRRAGSLVAGFLSGPHPLPELLLLACSTPLASTTPPSSMSWKRKSATAARNFLAGGSRDPPLPAQAFVSLLRLLFYAERRFGLARAHLV